MSDSLIRIIIAGSRSLNDYDVLSSVVDDRLESLFSRGVSKNYLEIVCGGAKGADTLGAQYAKDNQISIKYFLPDWSLGKVAGYIRNKEMAEYAADAESLGMLIAFWDKKSKGTKMMIDLAKKYGLLTYVHYV